MGYYGMPAAKLPPGRRSALEEALFQIQSLESLEIMEKLLRNAAVSPKEDKFRRIRLTNAKVNSAIVAVPGCLEALMEMGWERSTEEPEFLCIAAGRYMTMAEVRKVQDAMDRVRKEERSSTSADAPTATTAVKVQA
mmetsp:Transcript_18265/g.54518  ORF Transcript_18265/g.54518 Transcript_18265/m.54518 type:complete len:137 (-) Transcript_18265:267-677(-)